MTSRSITFLLSFKGFTEQLHGNNSAYVLRQIWTRRNLLVVHFFFIIFLKKCMKFQFSENSKFGCRSFCNARLNLRRTRKKWNCGIHFSWYKLPFQNSLLLRHHQAFTMLTLVYVCIFIRFKKLLNGALCRFLSRNIIDCFLWQLKKSCVFINLRVVMSQMFIFHILNCHVQIYLCCYNLFNTMSGGSLKTYVLHFSIQQSCKCKPLKMALNEHSFLFYIVKLNVISKISLPLKRNK